MIYYPGDFQFVDALTYASTRREYVDIFLKEKGESHPLRAFIDRLTGGGESLTVELTNGSILHLADILKIDIHFPDGDASEAISCLCQ